MKITITKEVTTRTLAQNEVDVDFDNIENIGLFSWNEWGLIQWVDADGGKWAILRNLEDDTIAKSFFPDKAFLPV